MNALSLRSSLLIAAACLSLAACGFGRSAPTVIDGSSPAAFEQTLGKAKRELSPKDRLKFEAALAEFRAQTFAKAATRQDYDARFRKGLNGLTAPRIVAKFNSNVDDAKRTTADTVFDIKRAVTGQRSLESDDAERP